MYWAAAGYGVVGGVIGGFCFLAAYIIVIFCMGFCCGSYADNARQAARVRPTFPSQC